MDRLSGWALAIVAAAVLLSPVLAFLAAIAVEILIGVLQDAGLLPLLSLVAIGGIGWSLLRKLWVRPRGDAPAET
jgi:hypothetical protein